MELILAGALVTIGVWLGVLAIIFVVAFVGAMMR
jgi:hypothetical protein